MTMFGNTYQGIDLRDQISEFIGLGVMVVYIS